MTSIQHNTFARYYRERIDRLCLELKKIIQFFTLWKDLQKYWAYLLPIFEHKDIALQMPDQHETFRQIDEIYRSEIKHTRLSCKTYKQFSRRESLKKSIDVMMRSFEYLMKCLIKYLEKKRQYFPRLYFLSNEQIIEIVGMMEDINTLEKSLFKMFEGIDKLLIVFSDDPALTDPDTATLAGVPSSPGIKRGSLLNSNVTSTSEMGGVEQEINPETGIWRNQDSRLIH